MKLVTHVREINSSSCNFCLVCSFNFFPLAPDAVHPGGLFKSKTHFITSAAENLWDCLIPEEWTSWRLKFSQLFLLLHRNQAALLLSNFDYQFIVLVYLKSQTNDLDQLLALFGWYFPSAEYFRFWCWLKKRPIESRRGRKKEKMHHFCASLTTDSISIKYYIHWIYNRIFTQSEVFTHRSIQDSILYILHVSDLRVMWNVISLVFCHWLLKA